MNKFDCRTGEMPGYGRYNCTKCGNCITVMKYNIIPLCPNCKNTKFYRA